MVTNPDDYGESAPREPFFKGSVNKRTCTDIICCAIFVATVVGYMTVGVLAWLLGDPRHVLFPRNSTGMFCGVGVNVNKPNVLYFDVLKCATGTKVMAATLEGLQCPTTQVCVEKCPSEFWKLSPDAFAPNAVPKDFFQKEYCDPSLDLTQTTLSVQDILNQELCPYFYTPSKPALGTCLPSFDAQHIPPDFSLPGLASSEETVERIKDAMGSFISGFNYKSVWVRIFEDFATTWYWILIGLVLAMVISLFFLLLMRFLVSLLAFVLIVGVLIVGAYGIYYCYWFYVYLQVKETWLTVLVILCILEFLILLLLTCLGKRVSFVLALLEESSRVVSCVMTTLVYPLVTFVLVVICMCYCAVISLYLATSGAPVYRVISLNSSMGDCHSIKGNEICLPQKFDASLYPGCPSVRCVFYKYDNEGFFPRIAPYLQIYNVLAFLWCVNFIIALGQCTLAGTFASFYWSNSKPVPSYPLLRAFIRTLRFHGGSVALGAVVLRIFQAPRMFLEYLYNRFRDCQNPCSRWVMISLKCCFWFLDKFIKFFHINTYIMIAIYGNSFSVSAKKAYTLLKRNVGRVVEMDSVTDTFLWSNKLLVVGLVGLLAFFFFSGRIRLPDDTFQVQLLHYDWLPTIMVMVGAYFVAQGFFSVYSMCTDTLFLCFLEDLEHNDGTMQRPYHMSRTLWQILYKP